MDAFARIGLYLAVLTLTIVYCFGQSQAQTLPSLRVAYTAIGGPFSALWMAKEAKLFEKNRINVELVYLAGGSRAVQALVAGDTPIVMAAGSSLVSARLAGNDVVIIGSAVNRFLFSLIGSTAIANRQDLKAKKIGITRFNSATDFALRYALRQWNMDPRKDVSIVQMGGQSEILAGLTKGVIDAGTFSSPTDLMARQAGFQLIADLRESGVPYIVSGIGVTGSFMTKNTDLVEKFMKSYVEGIAAAKRDVNFAIKVLGKYTRTTDTQVLKAAYKLYVEEEFQKLPRVDPESIKVTLETLAAEFPAADKHPVSDFFDNRFVDALSGKFVDTLYQ
jgi:ABC-type nitrate/sulfonate/bicarbonate transport system substrate-binding protein